MEAANNYTVSPEDFEKVRKARTLRTCLLDGVSKAIAICGTVSDEEWQQAFDQVEKIVISNRGSDRTP